MRAFLDRLRGTSANDGYELTASSSELDTLAGCLAQEANRTKSVLRAGILGHLADELDFLCTQARDSEEAAAAKGPARAPEPSRRLPARLSLLVR